MARTVYALFAGIDAYPAPVRPLNGCVNDVTRMRDLLGARVTGASDRFEPRLLVNEQVTRQGLIDAWRRHLGQAGPSDVALFYYSGHGSQEEAPPEFWDFDPDHLNETLVCYDSRLPGGWDLADKELAQLIAEVAANGPHFTVVLDCCHSGSGTRDSDEVTPRQEMADSRTRPIATYIVTPEQVAGLHGQRQGVANPAMPWASIGQGQHVLLAACRPEETAKETWFPGDSGMEKRGAFSYYLEDTLKSGAGLSYRDLFMRVSALVQTKVPDQSPQLEATHPEDLAQPFLGGAVQPGPRYFTLSPTAPNGWLIDGGALHGLPQPHGKETTGLAIFPLLTEPGGLRKLSNAIGQGLVTEVYSGQSQVTASRFDAAPLDRSTTYKAVVTSLPLPPLAVAFEGDEPALDLVRLALLTISMDGTPSLLVREDGLAQAEYRLLAEDDRFRICRMADAWTLAVDTPAFTTASAQLVAQRLEHIARWVSAARLVNPTSNLAPNAVQLAVFRERDGAELELLDTTSGLRLEYEQVDGGWRWPRIQVRLRNTNSAQRFFCMLLDLPETFSVYTGLLPRGGVWLESQGQTGDEAWATVLVHDRLRKTIDAYVPDALFQQQIEVMAKSGKKVEEVKVRDILKLIVSTDEADATSLQQGDLPVTFTRSLLCAVPMRPNSLNRLMARVHTRAFLVAPANDEDIHDWTTLEVAMTVERPAEATIVV